jgi:hypothetical protein
MASVSKLTLPKFEHSQTHQEPELERRAKALEALAQQRDILYAALKVREHTVKSAYIHLSITKILSTVLTGGTYVKHGASLRN